MSLLRALRHEVVTSSGRVLIGSVVAVIANGLGGIVSARALSISSKGLLAMVLTIGPMVWVVASCGTNVALRVELRKAGGEVTIGAFRRVSIWLSLVQVAFTLILVAVAARFMPGFELTATAVLLVLALSVSTFVSSQALEAMHAVDRSPDATKTDAYGAVVTLVLMIVMVACGLRTLTAIVACYLVGYVFRIAFASVRIHRFGPEESRSVGSERLLKRGLSFFGFNVGQVIAYRADRYLLGPLSSPMAVGIYSVAATPAELLRLPVTALGQVMMQRSARAAVTARTIRRTCLLAAAVTVPPAVVLFILAPELIDLLFGPRYAAASGVLRIMIGSELAVCFFIVLSRISAGVGLARSTSVSTTLGAVVGLTCLIWLAPTYGAFGAAWASFISYVAMLISCIASLSWHLAHAVAGEERAVVAADSVQGGGR